MERNLSPNTVAAYRRDLEAYRAFLAERGVTGPDSVTRRDVEDFVAHRREAGAADASVNRALSAVKGLHRFLVREGISTTYPTSAIRTPKAVKRLPDVISIDQAVPCSTSRFPPRRRVRATTRSSEVLYGCGLRVSELTGLDVRDLHLEEEFLL